MLLFNKVRPSPSFVSFLNFFGSEFNFYLSLDLKILQRFSSKVSPFDKRFGSVPCGFQSLYQHYIRRCTEKSGLKMFSIFDTVFFQLPVKDAEKNLPFVT